MAESKEKKTKKNPPFHVVAMEILDGKRNKAMGGLEIFTWDTISSLAYIISQSRIPEEACPDVTTALITDIKSYDYDGLCKIYETFAMAIISMSTVDFVEKEMQKESLNDDEIVNLQELLKIIGET